MKRRLFYCALSAVLGLNLVVGAQIYLSSSQGAEKDDVYPNLKLFSIVLDRVRTDYVDGGKLSYQELIHGALKGMPNTLDPHSEFMEPSKYEDLKKDTQGEFGGVGIVISVKDNFLTVVAPMEDTPGFKAGILSGDRIVKIDGKSTEKFVLQDAVKKLRGEPGTDVSITIMRPTTGVVKDYKLTRAHIKVDTIKDINGKREFPLSDNNVGYIRIVQFGEHTASDLEDALDKLETKGAESLILDLRGNPGGLLDQAVKVAEKFLPRGQLVVSTERSEEHTSELQSRLHLVCRLLLEKKKKTRKKDLFAASFPHVTHRSCSCLLSTTSMRDQVRRSLALMFAMRHKHSCHSGSVLCSSS